MGAIVTKKEMVQIESQLLEKVGKMKDGGLTFPKGYNPNNAITGAMLHIKQETKLMSCDPLSLAESLVQMVTLGLDINSKQCYLIPYGSKAQLSISYFGQQTSLRRIKGVINIVSQPIFDGDTVDYTIDKGMLKNLSHKTSFSNRKGGKNVIGAYAVITLDEKVFGVSEYYEIMDFEEIKQAWGQGAMKGNSPAHKNFTQEMSKKTVINRAVKNFTNTMTDSKDNEVVSTLNKVDSEEFQRNNDKSFMHGEVVEEQKVTLGNDEVQEEIVAEEIVEIPNTSEFDFE